MRIKTEIMVPIRAQKTEPPPRVDGIRDEDLVERLRDGDIRALDGLFRRYGRGVGGVAARLLGSTQDVDDIVHDAFLSAFLDIGGLKDSSAFRSWVMQIAVNRVRVLLRRRGLERRLGLHRFVADATLEALIDPAASQDVRAELARVDIVLHRLPANLRLAWVLRFVEGFTLEETAHLCGCSLATVKRRIKDANRRVQAKVRVKEQTHD